MNAVDIGILIVVGIFAVGGLRRGFLLGLVDLVAFGLALVVAARIAGSVAAPLATWGVPVDLAAAAGFVIAVVVSLAVIGLGVRVLLAPLGALGSGTPLGWANSVLGLLPGTVRGLAIAALLVLLVSALPSEFGMRVPLVDSRLAGQVAATGREALDTGLAWAGIDPLALGVPYQPATGGGMSDLPFSGITAVDHDAGAEQTLLDVINQERAGAGLAPLLPDVALAEVGRQHGRAMFALGFLGHTSPNTDSPVHRAQILNPGFTRVGVAVLRTADHGLLVTQEFAGS